MRASEAVLLKWRMDPSAFVRECFGAIPDPWQQEALDHWNTNKKMALKACKGPGKTCFEAWMAWQFLLTRPMSRVYATSITAPNLRDNLWAEMSVWQQKSPILQETFEWNTKRIVNRRSPGNWFMSARSWEKTADKTKQSESLAGVHADYVLFIIDEVSGIPDAVVNTAEGALATGIECRMLIAGNPSMLAGPLYRACTMERDMWYVIEITGDPDDPKRSPRVKIEWARDQIKKWGRDNAWVLVNVFGKFPPASLNALITHDDIEKSMNRVLSQNDYLNAQRRLGIDVARFGDDSSVIFSRQGLRAALIGQYRNLDTNKFMPQVLRAVNDTSSEIEFVDGTGGWGAGTVDALIRVGRAPIEVISNSKADDPQYFNKRSEMYWQGCEWIKRGGQLPNDPELKEELEAITYTYQNDKLRIEEKQQVKEKIGRSPDKCDAFMLTFAIPDLNTMFPLATLGVSQEVLAQLAGAQARRQDPDFDPMVGRDEGGSSMPDFDPMKSNF